MFKLNLQKSLKPKTEPSFDPPKSWLDENYPIIRDGLKKACPDWSDDKLDEITRKTLSAANEYDKAEK